MINELRNPVVDQAPISGSGPGRQACSRPPDTAGGVSSVLAGWREVSQVPEALWSDDADRNLVRALLGEGEDLTDAVHRFADAFADAGGTLAECCAHLAALEQVVEFPTSAWELAPLVADVFYASPCEQAVDPLTGLMTGPSLHAVLQARQRRTRNGRSRVDGWELFALVTERGKDSADALAAEMGAAEVLATTLDQAEAIGHVGPGRFVAIVETDHADDRCGKLEAALAMRGIMASLRREALAHIAETAQSQLECLVRPPMD